MNKKLLYKKAYRILDNSTPLKFDCGTLCDSKCCSGNNNNGMMLFPDEGILFSRLNDFLKIRKETLTGSEITFSTCEGICDRKFRPLWCRVFPLTPYLNEKGELSIIEDPRVKYICPILSMKIKFNRVFVKNVFRTFHLLIEDKDIYDYLLKILRVLDDYSRFVGGIVKV